MTRIEWCDETINPLGHGCYGPGGTEGNPQPCPYCYAKALAARNMRGCELCKQFVPHTHFEQLEKLKKWKKPRTIFVCSMADLFGEWVPDEWIRAVLGACEAAPQHRYLFLTKNPARYTAPCSDGSDDIFQAALGKRNWWFGTTACTQKEYEHRAMWLPLYKNCFLSIEPIQSEINFVIDKFNNLRTSPAKWIIIGAETGNRRYKVIPKREWIERIVEQCREAGAPVFMKSNLAGVWQAPLIQDLPWEA